MADPNLNTMLKWGIENSKATQGTAGSKTQLSPAALQALFGGNMKSDADYMRENMVIVQDESAALQDRVQAFDNFEQLIENLDNANNIEALQLWTPLIKQLENKEAQIREYAAWCCSTAVQNNIRTQERLLIVGAIPTLVHMAVKDSERLVRKKAINALSSAIRNFQPGLDAAMEYMPAEFAPDAQLDANDMESVDLLIGKLRQSL